MRPVQTTCGGCTGSWGDAFVAKLDPAGALSYGTFLGGTSDDGGLAVAVDTTGTAYVAGKTWSLYPADFPTTNGALPTGSTDGVVYAVEHAFVARLTDRPAAPVALAVSQTASADPAVIGVPFTYTVTVSNDSDADAPNVALVQTLSPEVSFVSATPRSGECALTAAKKLICNSGALLASGGQATVGIDVVPNKKAP